MTYQFDGLTVTDNTKELHSGALFLKTAQNERYFDGKSSFITPKELLKQLNLNDMFIVGVTGTNGKTTTTAAIYSFLNDLGFKAALQGTRGFFIADEKFEDKTLTTPSILHTIAHLYEARKRGVNHFIMEVSSHAIAQKRIEDIPFALKVLTNVSQDHLDFHKTMQNYIETKSSFFSDETLKLINKEEKNIRYNLTNARTYALEELATYQILAYSLEDGISAVLRFGSEMFDFHSPMRGLFNLYNLTAAIGAVHMITDKPLKQICEVVENFGGVRGRMEVVSQKPLVIVDFAHTPDGMQKVFESFPGKKIVALFGAGGERDRTKRALMGNVASRFCTKIILSSDNPRSENPIDIIEDIKRGIVTDVAVEVIVDRKEAISKALEGLGEDEILLVLGKGDEDFIEMAQEKIPHNDALFIGEKLSR